MIPIILLIVTLTLSLTISRIGTLALTLTGMSPESAHFQARSAFYGVGFTTHESETVVNHPVRRRIITSLMLSGNLGIATAVASLLGSIMSTSSTGLWLHNMLLLAAALSVLVVAASSRLLHRVMSAVVTWALRRWTTLEVNDYVALLNLSAGYAVLQIRVEEGDGLADRTLGQLNLPDEGILVLGIQRPRGGFRGAPTGKTRVHPQDVLIVYGPTRALEALNRRRSRENDLNVFAARVNGAPHAPREENRHAEHEEYVVLNAD